MRAHPKQIDNLMGLGLASALGVVKPGPGNEVLEHLQEVSPTYSAANTVQQRASENNPAGMVAQKVGQMNFPGVGGSPGGPPGMDDPRQRQNLIMQMLKGGGGGIPMPGQDSGPSTPPPGPTGPPPLPSSPPESVGGMPLLPEGPAGIERGPSGEGRPNFLRSLSAPSAEPDLGSDPQAGGLLQILKMLFQGSPGM